MILVLQFRTDQSGWHEVKCIYDKLDRRYNEFLFLNIMSSFVTTELLMQLISLAKGVVLGGLGEGGYEDTESHKIDKLRTMITKIKPLIDEVDKKNIPTLGICFGHQVLADILGGKVITDVNLAESGVTEIFVTEEGKKDPLLATMPDVFQGIVSHKSSVIELPQEAVLLAYSEKCPIQGFRYKSHIYGFQLHPELTVEDHSFRMQLYPEYMQHKVYNDNQEVIAHQILTNFLHIV